MIPRERLTAFKLSHSLNLRDSIELETDNILDSIDQLVLELLLDIKFSTTSKTLLEFLMTYLKSDFQNLEFHIQCVLEKKKKSKTLQIHVKHVICTEKHDFFLRLDKILFRFCLYKIEFHQILSDLIKFDQSRYRDIR